MESLERGRIPFKRRKSRSSLSALRSSSPRIDHRDICTERVDILYEDEAIIVVNKPACLPMHANLDENRHHLVDILSRQLAKRDGTAGYLGIHQRLDWGTSGTVMFTRCREANASIAEQFAKHSLEKVYLAIVYGHKWPKSDTWRVDIPLGDPVRKGCPVQIGGVKARSATTYFRILGDMRSVGGGNAKKYRCAWVEARLESGRKHQVRAHLSSIALHIYGDELYGGADICRLLNTTVSPVRAMLHAFYLSFVHPMSGKKVCVKADIPEDMKGVAKALGLPASIDI